jgi:hypothetical protein
MKNLILILFLFGITTPLIAQIIELPEVFINPDKYKYIYEVAGDAKDENVKNLEMEIAKFDVTKQEYYDDEYDTYTVSFYIPQGYAVAVYDGDGNLLRTIERYRNVKLPIAVSQAIAKRFPQWTLDKDVYKVIFNEKKWNAKKVYKLKLTNGEKSLKVKTDEEGNFL